MRVTQLCPVNPQTCKEIKIDYWPLLLSTGVVYKATVDKQSRWLSGQRICLQCRRCRRLDSVLWSRKWQSTPVYLPEKPHRGACWAIVHGVAKSQTQLRRARTLRFYLDLGTPTMLPCLPQREKCLNYRKRKMEKICRQHSQVKADSYSSSFLSLLTHSPAAERMNRFHYKWSIASSSVLFLREELKQCSGYQEKNGDGITQFSGRLQELPHPMRTRKEPMRDSGLDVTKMGVESTDTHLSKN